VAGIDIGRKYVGGATATARAKGCTDERCTFDVMDAHHLSLGPAAVYRAVFADDVLATLHQVAIGPSIETRRMYVSARDDSSSVLAISETQRDNFPGCEEIGTTEVMMAPLDHYLSRSMLIRPALLKLDVEGFEYGALFLRGLYNLLFDKDGRTLQADCLFRRRARSLQAYAAGPRK
jgi:FkbM family methyltransferase